MTKEVDEVAKRNSAPPTREIVSLTSLRGILAVWVVVHHFWNDLLKLFPDANFFSPVTSVGYMAVPVFFMLSGFVLSYNYANRFRQLKWSDLIRFLVLRLARVYPVHLLSLLVVALIVFVSDRLGEPRTDFQYTNRNFVLNLFLIQTWVKDYTLDWNYPAWSISSEWFAYLIFPFAVAGILRRLTTVVRAIGFGIVAFLASVGVVLFWNPWPFYELVLVLPTFLTGAAVHWILRPPFREPSWTERWMPELLLLSLVAICFIPSIGIVATLLLMGFAGILLVFVWLGEKCNRLWKAWPAVFLGEISYSLYMTHTIAHKVLNQLLPATDFELATTPTKLGIVAIYIGSVMAICLATFFLVEEPSRRFFKKRLDRGKTAPS